jgi:protein-S-isoprenylcysteine O-methyltransferase Ste14
MKQGENMSDTSRGVLIRLIQVIGQYLVLAVILFAVSGRLDWIWAWIYLGLGMGIFFMNVLVLPPELMAERGRPKNNVKRWDRVLTGLAMLPLIGVFVVSGLDKRFEWSAGLSLLWHILGMSLFVTGMVLFTWAMVSNRNFSTLVRIQMDRGHQVATGGCYRFIRHPGYFGYIISVLGTSLGLGSIWAAVPAAVLAFLIIVRTALEDRTLIDELPGYSEYAVKVRFRLLPGIW